MNNRSAFSFSLRIMALTCFSLSFFLLSSQNLAPNPSFETYDACPSGPGSGAPLPCIPWKWASQGTPDYFNSCANPSLWGVPDNMFGSEDANTGNGYAGAYLRYSGDYREYIQAPLEEALSAGIGYYVKFYVSLADQTCGIQTIGALFSNGTPPFDVYYPIEETPQIESNIGFIGTSNGWISIEGCFIAEGGENYITIGNFHDNANTPVDPDCPNGTNNSYYYIEDVLVLEVVPLEDFFDLGDPVTACDFFTIDPELTNVQYHWSDGSTEPTLTVTTSGMYYLTISSGCDASIDSIEITIEESLQVSIEPELDSICTGESFIISLNPDDGEYTWSDGSTNPEITITESGTYSVTLDDGCAISSDQIIIIVVDPPEPFSLGSDTFLCDGEEIEIMLDPSLGEFLWQDNSTSSGIVITNNGTYSLTISNFCGEQISEINVSSAELPSVDLSGYDTLLCAFDFMTIELDPMSGSFEWQDGSTLPNYTITSEGLYSVTVTNVCGAVSDDLNVIQLQEPEIVFDALYTLCPGDSLILNAGAMADNYLWGDGSTNSTLLVTQPGQYSVTIQNECGSASDETIVEIVSMLPALDLGPDFSLCPGEVATLASQIMNVSYAWQDGSAADTLLVNGPGMYSLEITNGCEAVSDTVVVEVNDSPPQVDLPDQLVLCQGTITTINAGLSGVAYLWSDGSTGPQLMVTSTGTYSLTVTNTCGTDRDTVIVIDGGPAPMVSLGMDTSLCPGETILLMPSNADVDAWLWQDGSTLPTYSISNAGQYTVEVSNSCGSSYDTINATVLPPIPILDIGLDTSLCPGESVVLNISTPDVDILWSDGSTGPSFITSGEGFFFASITNSCGSSFDTMEVVLLPDIPILNLGPDQSLCPGEILMIDPGIANVSYLWQDGSTNTIYNANQQETIILTISNSCGTSTDTLQVIENNLGPQVNLGPDILACEGDIITIPAGISGVNYLWQDGSVGSSFVTNVSGEFILQVSNNCGIDVDTILVDIHGAIPVVDLGPDTSLCQGNILVLSASADTETSVQWQDGSAQLSYTISSTGVYSLFESNHCGEDADTISVSFVDGPVNFSLGPDTTLCSGDFITLNAPNTTSNILWQDGSDQLTMIADQEQVYWLQLSNECGITSDSVFVTIDNLVPILNLDTSIPWCEGDVITLDATQPFVADYLWSNGAVAPAINVSTPDIYSVIVSTPCSTISQQVDVFPGPDCVIPVIKDDLYIPNVFSPTGDGINDVFTISYGPDLNVTAMEGSIYDRWGNLVFSSTEIPFKWDGLFNGEFLQPGVFVYLIRITYVDSTVQKEVLYSGDITLVR